MKRTIAQLAAVILFFSTFGLAQEPLPKQTPPEEPIKISTEEVHLNVLAQSSSGRFVSTLRKEDLLVVEDGTPQEIAKLERVPANVLLLLDTGREINFVKSLDATEIIAQIFVYSLPPDNFLSVMQYYDKIETVSDWNKNYEAAAEALRDKLSTGKRSRLTEALYAAIESFKSRPLENRHLVLITDGADTVADVAARQKALRNLLAANITVHVISYTRLEEQQAQKATRLIRLGDGTTKPRIDPLIYDDILRGMVMGKDGHKLKARLKQMNEAQALVIVNIDKQRKQQVEKKQVVWKQAETKLQTLAEETGGVFQAPEELNTTFKLAGEIARAVDSQYVITYTPKKPFMNTAEAENRKVRVSTYCEGVKIQSRQKIVVNSN